MVSRTSNKYDKADICAYSAMAFVLGAIICDIFSFIVFKCGFTAVLFMMR